MLVFCQLSAEMPSFIERFYGGITRFYNDISSPSYIQNIPITVATEGISTSSEKVRLITSDGLTRHGVLTLRTPARANVILCHPAAYDKECMIPYEQKVFETCNCLRFDFRRHGQDSDGQITTLGKAEVFELQAAIDLFKTRSDTRDLPLYGFGISMGGAVLIEAESKQSQFDGLIIQSTFDSMRQQIKRLFPFFRVPLMQGLIFTAPMKFYAEKRYRIQLNKVDPVRSIAQVTTPIFLIHADDDPVITVDAYYALKSAGTSIIKSWNPPRGLHTAIFRTFPEMYRKHVTDFFAQIESARTHKIVLNNHALPAQPLLEIDLTSTTTNQPLPISSPSMQSSDTLAGA